MKRSPDTSTPSPADGPESRRPRRRYRPLAVAALATIAVAGAGTVAADAATSHSAKIIHACVNKSTGVLSVVGAHQKCTIHQRYMTFNRTGPRGQVGATGATGRTGPRGPRGPQGPQGAAGTAVGWAVVESDGTIYSHGGSLATPTITHPATGVYCITGTGWVQQGGPYSVNLVNSGNGGQVAINPYFWGSVCNPTGFFVAVHTFDTSGSASDAYFMISKLD